MNSNIKMSVGLIIPLVAIIVFSALLYAGNNIAAIFTAIGGLFIWFLYSSVMGVKMPDITGNIIIIFGFLLSSAFFFNYGLTRNMFGGYEINLEGVATSPTLLFVIVLIGINFRQRSLVKDNKSFDTISEPHLKSDTAEKAIDGDNDIIYDDSEVDYDYDYDYDYESYYDYEDDPEE